jgi:hypothetical protein
MLMFNNAVSSSDDGITMIRKEVKGKIVLVYTMKPIGGVKV